MLSPRLKPIMQPLNRKMLSLQALHDKQIEIKRAVPRDQMPPPRGLPLPGRGGAAPPYLAYGRGAPYAGYPPYPQVRPFGIPAHGLLVSQHAV